MSNVFSFTGACGNDAEVRYLPTGTAVLTVNVANSIGYGDNKKTIWVRVALFGKAAEGPLKEYLKKGVKVFVSGELSVSEWEKDGTKRFNLELRANTIDLISSKSDSQNHQDTPQANTQSPHNTAKSNGYQTQQNPQHDNFNDGFNDNIPF